MSKCKQMVLPMLANAVGANTARFDSLRISVWMSALIWNKGCDTLCTSHLYKERK